MKKPKITKEMLKAANDVMPSLKAESIRAILEVAFDLIELPTPKKEVKKNLKGKPTGVIKQDDFALLTMIPRLKNGEEVIIPIAPGKNVARMQPNLKTLQIRNKFCPDLKIITERILYFSPRNPRQMFDGVKCVISRPSDTRA